MKVAKRNPLDVELTNRCNALCSFCPRDATPAQGFMTSETFKQVIARAKELDVPPQITLTGQGESTLHPQLVDFVAEAVREGVKVFMTTNANRLDRELSRSLLEAGLSGVTFSVSDMGEDYELVYNLNWEKTRNNILDFLELRDQLKRPLQLYLSIVEHDLNKDKIEHMKAYWRERGLNGVLQFPQNNRGGACDNAHYFIGNNRFEQEARIILSDNKASSLCSMPFSFVFIGWNGQYYICCSDYKKESPLGSVFDYSIAEMDEIKLNALLNLGLPACLNCNIDPVNAIREKLFDAELGHATESDAHATANHYALVNNPRLPQDIDIFELEKGVFPV